MATRDSNFRSSLMNYHRDTYVTGRDQQSRDSVLPIIDCTLGHSPFYFTRSYSSYLKALTSDDLAKYPSDILYREFCRVVIERFGSGLQEKNIFFGHGSFNIIERIFHKILRPGVLLGVSPQFLELPSEFIAAGGEYRPVPLRAGLPCIQELAVEIRTGKYVALYFDNPNNPTGYAFSLEDIETLALICHQTGTVMIIDEAYGDYIPDEQSAFSLISRYDNLVVVRSFSKCFGLAAIRSGYAAVSDNLLQYFTLTDIPFEPGSVSIVLSVAALQDHEFLSKIRTRSESVKSYFVRQLEDLGFSILPTNPQTPIFVVQSDAYSDFAGVLDSLNVRCVPGSAFVKDLDILDDYAVRIRIPPSYEVVDEFIRRLKSVT